MRNSSAGRCSCVRLSGRFVASNEPLRVWRRLQLLRKWSHYEQDKEQVFF